MKKLLTSLALLGVVACSGAPARYAKSRQFTAITTADLDPSTPLGFDSAVRVRGYTIMNLEVAFTRVAGTNVQMTCYTGETAAAAEASGSVLQTCAVSSGNCTSSDTGWTKTISATDTWTWLVNVVGLEYVYCTLISASSTSDTAGVGATLFAGPL